MKLFDLLEKNSIGYTVSDDGHVYLDEPIFHYTSNSKIAKPSVGIVKFILADSLVSGRKNSRNGGIVSHEFSLQGPKCVCCDNRVERTAINSFHCNACTAAKQAAYKKQQGK